MFVQSNAFRLAIWSTLTGKNADTEDSGVKRFHMLLKKALGPYNVLTEASHTVAIDQYGFNEVFSKDRVSRAPPPGDRQNLNYLKRLKSKVVNLNATTVHNLKLEGLALSRNSGQTDPIIQDMTILSPRTLSIISSTKTMMI